VSVQSYNAQSLPSNDNINSYSFCIDVQGEWFVQSGKMIAYYGQMKFEALSVGSIASLVAASFSAPLYTRDFMVVRGQGKCILGDRGFDINSYDLTDGNLTVRAGNLLGFEPRLQLKQSIVPGFLTLIGTGKFLASSNGPVHFVEPPIRVDPQALVGWSDCPSPCHHYDAAYMQGFLGALQAVAGLGMQSGEEHQFDFTGAGTVIMQSSEAVRDTGALARDMESQLGLLGTPSLQMLQARIQQRLSAQTGA
jgi:uncharacterized protein (AIM24 family)